MKHPLQTARTHSDPQRATTTHNDPQWWKKNPQWPTTAQAIHKNSQRQKKKFVTIHKNQITDPN